MPINLERICFIIQRRLRWVFGFKWMWGGGEIKIYSVTENLIISVFVFSFNCLVYIIIL